MADKDYTAYLERVVHEEGKKLSEQLKTLVNEVRPMGTREVPVEEQELEFKMMLDYPEVYTQFLKDQGASVESAIKYAHEMQKRVKGK